MAKVFVPNIPMRRHPETYAWVPDKDLRPAERRGELVELFTHKEVLAGVVPLEAVAMTRLAMMNPDEDYVVQIGSPAAQAILARAHLRLFPGKKLRLLVWDRRLRDYLLAEVA